MIVSWIGPLCVFSPWFIASREYNLITFAVSVIAAELYFFLMVWIRGRLGTDQFSLQKKWVGIWLALLVRFGIVLLFLWERVLSAVSERLLPTSDTRLIAVLFGAAFVCCGVTGIEKRARAAEVLFWIVLVPVLLVLAGGLFQMDGPVLDDGIRRMASSSDLQWLKVVQFVFFFCPAELILLKEKEPERVAVPALFLGAVTVVAVIVCVGIFGYQGLVSEQSAFLAITGYFQLFGTGIFRHDSIFICFLLFSFFFGAGSLFGGLSSVLCRMTKIRTEKRSTPLWVGAPLGIALFAILLCWPGIKWRGGEKTPDLEEKVYLLAVGIDRVEDAYRCTFLFSTETEPNKTFVCTADSMEEADRLFCSQSDKLPEYSHVQMIVVGETLYNAQAERNELLSQCASRRVFSSDTLFVQAKPSAAALLSAEKEESVALYLKELIAHTDTGKKRTIGEAVNRYRNGLALREPYRAELAEETVILAQEK